MFSGKHSGRHAIEERLKELGYSLNDAELDKCYEKFKALTDKKKCIVDSDLEALVNNIERIEQVYTLEYFDVHTAKNASSTCVIRLRRQDDVFEEVSLGDGPVNAAYNAIDKITGNICSEMSNYTIHSVSDGKRRFRRSHSAAQVRRTCGKRAVDFLPTLLSQAS